MFGNVPRLYRRAILIYLGTIVAPACGLLWLGVQSFERQRQALVTLTAEKLSAELDAETNAAAERAFSERSHPIVKYFFTIEHGAVVHPALDAPLPRRAPAEFSEAEHQELDLNRPDLALQSYRKLLALHKWDSLVSSRIARSLSKLGRDEEAKAAWRTLAASYPDDRDLSNRPFGIVAAINAGDTVGLCERISGGRWELAADQAEYFLRSLDPARTSPYLDQFRFARELTEQFKPPRALVEDMLYTYTFGGHRIFYRADSSDRISGFAANLDWIEHSLRPDLERRLGVANTRRQDLLLYGGAIALVLLILSAGVVLLLRDITREARTNRLRSDFVSGVSHELKTPITLIRLYGETLLRHPAFSEQERKGFYGIITRESARLGRLVDRILTFSRVEREEQGYELEEGDLAPLIAGIVDDYSEWLERAGFSVDRVLPPSAPPVMFDAAALSQAVINLLDNAVKYSGASRAIAVRLAASQGSVSFEVEDHGLGIPAAEQDKIFERFYRVSNGQHGHQGGYGLGLFVVRHIMDAHGGRAEVDSEPGRGSRFRLVFPTASHDSAAHPHH